MEERKNFYLFFKEAIHNAFKHADCTVVKVDIDNKEKNINMRIEDNGKGFDVSKNFMGNGLNNMRNRAAEIGGTIKIDCSAGTCTTVCLDFKTTQTGS
jgi:signal transduction histidine kinase